VARIRTIKPEFWQDEDLAGTSYEARLMAIALLNHADDEGYFRAHPSLVKAACFAFDDDSSIVRRTIDELSNIGYLELFLGLDGKRYGRISGFSKHQRVDRKKESTIKGLYDSSSPRRSIDDQSTLEGKGKEVKEKTTNVVQKKKPKTGKTLVPADWVPDEKLSDWFHDQQFDFTLASMVESYIDGCHSKRLMYVDHCAAFRNWSKMRHERQAKGGGGAGESRAKRHHDKLREIAERSIAEERARETSGGGAT
jgi:hypothetical protein